MAAKSSCFSRSGTWKWSLARKFPAVRSAISGSLCCGAPPHHHTGSRELFYVVSGAAQKLAEESIMTADEGELSGLIRCTVHARLNANGAN
jgi:mannose-6-phosphate isomerase-like protein (cupin superfamily)